MSESDIYPSNSLENSLTPCFFVCRQALGVVLEKQALAQLPNGHRATAFIREIQEVLSHLLEVYTLIVNFLKAGNNNDPTWTPTDKHWKWILEYENKWKTIEDACRMSAFMVSGRVAEKAQQSSMAFMTGEVIKCDFGFSFFEALISPELYHDIGEYFNEVEAFCEKVEQECVADLA